MGGPLSANISIREFDGTVWTGGKSIQGTFQIPIVTSIGSVADYAPTKPYIHSLHNYRTVKTLHVQVTDLDGTVVDINNQDWVLKCSVYNKYDRQRQTTRYSPY